MPEEPFDQTYLPQTFARLKDLEDTLNDAELNNTRRVIGLGVVSDVADATKAMNFYDYVIDLKANRLRRLELREISPPPADQAAWEAAVMPLLLQFELLEKGHVLVAGKRLAAILLRPVENPIKVDGAGRLSTDVAGWEWLVPQVHGNDLVVSAALCTWFGGPHDTQDTGETASGVVNTRRQTDYRGCSLPMNGFRRSKNTLGSPLPRFRWLTPVEVTCVDPDLEDRQITLELIDLGPARATRHAIDLTEPAFNALGAASSRGVVRVDFTIRNWQQHLEPSATFTLIPSSSSEQKPLDATGQRVRPAPTLPPAWDIAGFRAFVAGLALRFISADELLPYFASVRNGVANEPPDPALWPNFAPTLLILDALRRVLNAPVHLTSTYRHPHYNRQLDGAATLSQHMAFRAADVQATGKTPRQVHDALRGLRGTRLGIPSGAQFTASAMVNSGHGVDSDTPFNLAGLQIQNPSGTANGSFIFEGGLGLYQTFVHVDCRGIHQDW